MGRDPPCAWSVGWRVNGRPFVVMVVTYEATVRAYAHLGQYLLPRTMRSMLAHGSMFYMGKC